jgi:hypothetical protein
VPASIDVTRLVLRKLAADATLNGKPLADVLQSVAFGTVTQAISGKILVEARADGLTSRYELPVGQGALQPQEVSAMLSRLLDLYDAAVAALPTNPTDAAILSQMLGQIYPVRSYFTAFNTAIPR